MKKLIVGIILGICLFTGSALAEFVTIHRATRHPSASDDVSSGMAIGDVWQDEETGAMFVCYKNIPNKADWRILTASGVTDITGTNLSVTNGTITTAVITNGGVTTIQIRKNTRTTYVDATTPEGGVTLTPADAGTETIFNATSAHSETTPAQVWLPELDGTTAGYSYTIGREGTAGISVYVIGLNDQFQGGANSGVTAVYWIEASSTTDYKVVKFMADIAGTTYYTSGNSPFPANIIAN